MVGDAVGDRAVGMSGAPTRGSVCDTVHAYMPTDASTRVSSGWTVTCCSRWVVPTWVCRA
eukprot:1385351-Rhodomonas_salina.1